MSGPAAGGWNLSLDESIFRGVRDGSSPPTLRFYCWSPPVLSIGYAQDRDRDVDLESCRARGIDVVRRLTGGRAVLHDDEVSYSVCSPADPEFFGSGITSSGTRIAEGLLAGLTLLGIPGTAAAGRPPGGRPAPRSPDCFAASSSSEIEIQGRKAVGSAQRREGGAFLQHGSIPIGDPGEALESLLRPVRTSPRRPRGLTAFLGRTPGRTEVIAALERGFASAWGVRFLPGTPTRVELDLAAMLERERYRSGAWNGDRGRRPAAAHRTGMR